MCLTRQIRRRAVISTRAAALRRTSAKKRPRNGANWNPTTGFPATSPRNYRWLGWGKTAQARLWLRANGGFGPVYAGLKLARLSGALAGFSADFYELDKKLLYYEVVL